MLIKDLNPDALLNEHQTAELLGCSYRTLQTWRSKKRGPPYVKAEGSVRYRVRGLLQWIDERTRNPSG